MQTSVEKRTQANHLMAMLTGLCLVLLLQNPLSANDSTTSAEAVRMQWLKHPNGTPGIRVTVTVSASATTIWHTLTDYEHFTDLFDNIDRMEILEKDQHGATLAFWVDGFVKDVHYIIRRSYPQPGEKITWTLLGGDLEQVEGSWQITKTSDPKRCVVTYESFVDIGSRLLNATARVVAGWKAKSTANKLRAYVENKERHQQEESLQPSSDVVEAVD